MTTTRKLLLTVAFIALSGPLTACESVNTAMNDIGQKFSDMNLSLPDIKSRDDVDTYVDDERMASGHSQTASKQDTAKTEGPLKVETIVMSDDSDNSNCPKVNVVRDLSELHQFNNPDHPSPSTNISDVKIADLHTGCKFSGDNVAVELDITFKGDLGPAARTWSTDKPSFAYPYFVAITTPDGNIVAKEVFAATIRYEKNQNEAVKHESLRQIIPINGQYDTDHSIVLGFQLTDAELAYNRSLMPQEPKYAHEMKQPGMKTAVYTPPQQIETSAGEEEKFKPMTIVPQHKPKHVAIKKTAAKKIAVEPVKAAAVPAVTEEKIEDTAAVIEETTDQATGDTVEESASESMIKTVTQEPPQIPSGPAVQTPMPSSEFDKLVSKTAAPVSATIKDAPDAEETVDETTVMHASDDGVVIMDSATGTIETESAPATDDGMSDITTGR